MAILKNKFTEVKDNDIFLTDVNGKEMNADINYFTDFSTDLCDSNINEIVDSEYSLKDFSVEINDSEGNSYDIGDPQFIQKIEDGSVKALDVVIESTHTGANNNNVNYTEESMIEDSATFLTPFCKPLIKNHDNHEEPLGRAIESRYSDSEIVDGKGTIDLTVRVFDKAAMLKFADGRYKTVSVSGSAKRVSCNICGKNIVKDGNVKFCGHFKGNVYSGRKAIWQMEDITYKECSVVNNPADIFAQVKKINTVEVNEDMAKKKCKGSKSKGGKKKNKFSDSEDQNLELNNVDDLLDNEDDEIEEEKNENSKKDKSTSSKKSKVKDENENDDDNDDVENDDEVSSLKDEVAALKKKVKKLNKKVSDLEDEIEEKNEAIEDLNDSLEEAEELADSNETLAKKMAKLNKNLLIKHYMVLDEDASEKKLRKLKATKIAKMIEDFEEEIEDEEDVEDEDSKSKRTVKKINNPSLANKSDSDVEDEDEEEKISFNRTSKIAKEQSKKLNIF